MAEIKSLAVVGSGQMGSGIAQLGAMHGLHVWLLDTDPVALSRAYKTISSSLQRFVSKGQLSQLFKGGKLRKLVAEVVDGRIGWLKSSMRCI